MITRPAAGAVQAEAEGRGLLGPHLLMQVLLIVKSSYSISTIHDMNDFEKYYYNYILLTKNHRANLTTGTNLHSFSSNKDVLRREKKRSSNCD
jgi:hypothetical protein